MGQGGSAKLTALRTYHLQTYFEVREKNICVVLDQELTWHLDSEINKLSKWEKPSGTIGNLVSL